MQHDQSMFLLISIWRTLLETATVHADNRITFRFKDGTDIGVGAE